MGRRLCAHAPTSGVKHAAHSALTWLGGQSHAPEVERPTDAPWDLRHALGSPGGQACTLPPDQSQEDLGARPQAALPCTGPWPPGPLAPRVRTAELSPHQAPSGPVAPPSTQPESCPKPRMPAVTQGHLPRGTQPLTQSLSPLSAACPPEPSPSPGPALSLSLSPSASGPHHGAPHNTPVGQPPSAQEDSPSSPAKRPSRRTISGASGFPPVWAPELSLSLGSAAEL